MTSLPGVTLMDFEIAATYVRNFIAQPVFESSAILSSPITCIEIRSIRLRKSSSPGRSVVVIVIITKLTGVDIDKDSKQLQSYKFDSF